MKKTLVCSLSTMLLVGSSFFAGCATDPIVVMEPKPVPDSPTVEARVSRLFSADPMLKKFKILVNTFQGTVMLDGVVDSEEQRQQATKLV
ncbi:MAG: BON domain-containing protein [Pedosphaera sp.]|nr:BON domain-containing protein [Pedosphaera sp.]